VGFTSADHDVLNTYFDISLPRAVSSCIAWAKSHTNGVGV